MVCVIERKFTIKLAESLSYPNRLKRVKTYRGLDAPQRMLQPIFR